MNVYNPDFAILKLSTSHTPSTSNLPHPNTDPTPIPTTAQPTSPQRPKHLSTRSITEIGSIITLKHHHHSHLHHRDKDRVEKLDPRTSNSSLRLLGNTADGERSKSEGVSPNESRNVSRRGSAAGILGAGGDWEDSPAGMGSFLREKRIVREGEVREERERGVMRANELRNALLGLNTLSNNTTRRLDNSYYSVLEKLSVLQSTITSLKELAVMTKGLNQEFKDDSQDLVRDVTAQLEGFEEFAEQEKRITDLQQRVKAGRERTKLLGKRVDVVKNRVDGWEKAEGEWQERARKNFRILWILISVVMTIVLAVVVLQYMPPMTTPEPPKGLNTTGLLGKIPDFEAFKNESQVSRREVEERLEGGSRFIAQPEENPRLRVFDEL